MGTAVLSFVDLFFDLNFVTSDLVFLVCAAVLLCKFSRRPAVIARRVLDVLALLALDFVFALVQYLVTGGRSSGGQSSMPALFLALVIYATAQRRLRTCDKIARCSTFFASFVLVTGLVGLTGSVIPEISGTLRLPNVVSFVILMAIVQFLRRYSVSRFRLVPQSYAYLLTVICVIASAIGLTFIGFVSGSLGNDAETSLVQEFPDIASSLYRINFGVDFGLLVLILVAYAMFYQLTAEHSQRVEHVATHLSATGNAEMIEVTKSVYESMREMRHESKNQIAYVETLANDEQWDHLAEYIHSLRSDAAEVLEYVQSGNGAIDAVVNAKATLARSRGIQVKTMLAVPGNLDFDAHDIYALIANLMDNAIEGAAASDAENKVVRLSIRPEGGYFVVSTQNPCASQDDREGALSRLKTTKADSVSHGYGTKVIARIARRYKGMARYKVKDNQFMVSVLLVPASQSTAEE